MKAFTNVTKRVEEFALEEVLSLSQLEDCRQISVLIMLMSHDLSKAIGSE